MEGVINHLREMADDLENEYGEYEGLQIQLDGIIKVVDEIENRVGVLDNRLLALEMNASRFLFNQEPRQKRHEQEENEDWQPDGEDPGGLVPASIAEH